jgi:hypothetical protein
LCRFGIFRGFFWLGVCSHNVPTEFDCRRVLVLLKAIDWLKKQLIHFGRNFHLYSIQMSVGAGVQSTADLTPIPRG